MLIIHAGMPKTGTKSLQDTLSAAASVLENSGFIYPASFRHNNAHHPLARALRTQSAEGEHLLSAFNNFISERANIDILVSSEAFTNCFMKVVLSRLENFLAECANRHDVRIVLALRRIDAFFESMYLHSTKWGRVKIDFQDYLNMRRDWPAELFLSLATIKSKAFSDVEFVKYGNDIAFQDELITALNVPVGINVSRHGQLNRKLGFKAHCVLRFLDELAEIIGSEFNRAKLVRAFESGEFRFDADLAEYSLFDRSERQLFHELALQASVKSGVNQYRHFFEAEKLVFGPKVTLSLSSLTEEDRKKLARFAKGAGHS